MKRAILLFFVVSLLFLFNACEKEPEGITIPDLVGTEENVAKNVLSANGLIPTIKYINDDDIEKGFVVKTYPAANEILPLNNKIFVYVSSGPSFIQSLDARIEWWHISDYGEDDWQFENPYISEGILYIPCYDVIFSKSITWQDRYDEGEIGGIASVTDTFDKIIPVSAKYEKRSWKAGESQDFILEIPINDMETDKPTDIYLELYTDDFESVRVNFYMTW